MLSSLQTPFFSLENFYKYGASAFRLQPELAFKGKEIIDSFEWVVDPEGNYKSVPAFMAEKPIEDGQEKLSFEKYANQWVLDHTPKSVRQFFIDLMLSSQTDAWKSMYDFEVEYADLWNGSEGCPWHWDGMAKADVLVLVYFNAPQARWLPEDGGELLIGHRALQDPLKMHCDFSSVEEVGRIAPRDRTVVFVNNTNPLMVHKPEPVNTDKDRIVMTAGFRLSHKDHTDKQSQVIWPRSS